MMTEPGKISARQFSILVTFHLIGTAILVIPSILALEAKRDAWIAALLAEGAALLIMLLYVSLGSRFSEMTFAEYMEVILGKWIGKTISMLFFIAFPLLAASLALRNVGDFMTTLIMPETPIVAIHLLFLGVVVIGVRLGLEPFARTAELFFPWVVLLFFIMIASIAPQIKPENLQPLFEQGLKPVIKAAVPMIGFPFVEPVIFLMLFPYVNQAAKTGKALFSGVVLGGCCLFIVTILTILVLGPDQAARHPFPSYMLAKKISVGQFFERIEVIMAIMWFTAIYFRLTIFLYVTVLGIAQTLNVKDYRFLTLPLSMIIIVLSIVTVPSTTYLLEFNQKIWPLYAATFGLVLPLLLLVISVIRKKGISNK